MFCKNCDCFDGFNCVSMTSCPYADYVKVVRCGKCKYYEPHGNGKRGICRHPKLKRFLRHDTDYCSYGERRDT